MAAGIGKDAAFKITVATNLDQNIQAYLTQVSPSFPVDTAETTTMGDSDREFLSSLKSSTIGIEGIYDPTVDGYLFGLRGGTAAPVRYFPQGTASGKIYFEVNAILASYEAPANLDEAVTFSAEFQGSGAVTRGTV